MAAVRAAASGPWRLLVVAACLALLAAAAAAADARGRQAAPTAAPRTRKLRTVTDHGVDALIAPYKPDADFYAQLNSTYLFHLLRERVPGTSGHLYVQHFLRTQLGQLGWDVFEDKFTTPTVVGDRTFINFVATHNASAPHKLVLAAHYDSKILPNGVFLGATDSALPCALLLSLAHRLQPLLAQRQQRRQVTLQLIFFDGEEAFKEWTATDSLYGARHLAERWASEPSALLPNRTMLHEMEVLVLLDLLGTRNARIPSFFPRTQSLYNGLRRTEARLRQRGANNAGPGYPAMFVSEAPVTSGQPHEVVQDDHIPFLMRGVPIVHLIPAPFPAAWHTLADTAAVLDAGVVADWARILTVFVAEYLDLAEALNHQQV